MKKLIAVALLVALTACRERGVDASKNAAADTGGTATVAIANNPDFLNGLLSGDRWGQEINRNLLYMTLLRYDDKLTLQPYLASSYEMEGDTAVVMHLRNDVRWHDGAKTDAYDVEFTFRYGTDPKTEYPNGDYWVGWNQAQVIDSSTIRFSISPQPDALANLPWIPIMPRHLLEKVKPEDIKTAEFNQHPVGNGPFKFVDMKSNQQVVLEANRDFPEALGGRPKLSRFVLRVVPDETSQEAELITGDIDFVLIRPDKINSLKTKPGIRVDERQGKQFAFIAWNTKKPPFNDARVRRAMTMAIDRQKIINVIRAGAGSVIAGPVPDYHWSHDPSIKPLPYSPDSARKELAATGKQNLTFEFKVPSNNKQNADIAELIRADLAAVGVTAKVRLLDFNTIIGDLTSDKRNFEGALMAWENDFRIVLHDNFHSKAIGNPFQFSSYRNPAVDSLLDFVESTPSREAATPKWRRFQTIMRDEEPWSFLFSFSDPIAVRDRLQDVKVDIRGFFQDATKWKVKK